jgi:hypothetical protein
MKWATRELIHFDRVASAWLILRFIDQDAHFSFLGPDDAPDDDTTLFGIQGVRLASHDGEATTFQRILDAYSLDESGLILLGRVVADVVDHVMHDRERSALAARGPLVGGVLALAEGVMVLSATDRECLERSLLLYDALYARLQAQIAIERLMPSPPASVLQQTAQLANATGALRKAPSIYSSEGFVNALRAQR